MSDYRVEMSKGEFRVVELKTKYVLKTFNNPKDANAYKKFLNRGGSFAGFTPDFVARTFKVPGGKIK